ncbi:MAG: hypothetical protein OXE87_02535 [Chloroflexi bacterium]|nr:hypothetical protein [Chloroflexota bacterium]
MLIARTTLGVLCLLTALVTLGLYYFNAVDPVAAIPIWFVVDIFIAVAILLTVVVNVCDSLRIRRDPQAHLRQLPRDVITVIAGLVLMLFLHNHLLFALEPGSENVGLWLYLDPVLIAVLTWEGIALVRSRY